MVGDLLDGLLPNLSAALPISLERNTGRCGQRETYPDAPSGTRVELKLLYVDPPKQ